MKMLLVSTVVWTTLFTEFSAAETLVFGKQWEAIYYRLSNEEPAMLPPDWRQSIQIPPPPDDAFTRSEVEHIIALKHMRGRYQRQIEEQVLDVVHPFVRGLDLDVQQISALRAFWKPVVADVTRVHMYYKAKFDRARPRQYSNKVDPSIEPPGHPAYPSGHSTDAHTLALVLSVIWPDKKTQLLSIAYQVALNREIAGVHYRSDTIAGLLLARQIVALMKRKHSTRAAMDKLKTALTRG